MSRLKLFNLQFAFGAVANAQLSCACTPGPPLVFAAAGQQFKNPQTCLPLAVFYWSWLSARGFLQPRNFGE